MFKDQGMNRRDLLEQMALLLGVSALPAEAFAAPKRGAARYFAAPQYALLIAVVDTIIPATDTLGALAAQVPSRLDSMLGKWASAETRGLVTGAIMRIDTASLARTKKGFAALSAKERTDILRPYDVAALKKVPKPANAPASNFFSQIPYVADPGYLKLKEMVIQLYYFSAAANGKELLYEHVPGKFQPSIKLTPQSRPYLGTGPF